MTKDKNKTLTIVAIIVIVITLIGMTYAYFAPQMGGSTSKNTTVTSNTTDLLTFSINRDISFTVTQNDFQENGTNKSGDATATATLTPNNKTEAATMNYYLYLNLQSNPTVYSEANTNEDPELMLQVFDGSNQLVTLTGLGTQKTIKGVTGYDITGVSGLKTLLNNHAISASNNTATIENWRIVITLINLDVNQNDNTGKTISAEIIIRQDEIDESDLILNVANLTENRCNQPTISCNGVTSLWNNKLNQLEISSLEDVGSCNINCNTSSGTPLNTYIISLLGTNQGNGMVVHEIGTLADYTNASVVKNYGATPEFYMNSSYDNITQTAVDSYWTFNSSTGVFTSDPSKMTVSGYSAYYHAYVKLAEAGYYQICYTISQSSNFLNKLFIARNTEGLNSINSSTSAQIGETCYELGYFSSTDYLNVSEFGYSGTSSPVMTFRLEKSNNISQMDTGYRYEGKNPNNYLMFNNELWRIIGVFSTEYDTNNDGITDATTNLVKIIRESSIGGLTWNKTSGNDWSNSSLYHLLNEQYYDWNNNKENIGEYCYGSSTISPSHCNYTVKGIQDEYRNMIVNAKWYLGGGGKSGYNGKIIDNYYNYERDINAIYTGMSPSIFQHIGLMYLSDYLYGVLESDCARTSILYSNENCSGKDWLYKGQKEWTISQYSSGPFLVWFVDNSGDYSNYNANDGSNVRPVLNLSPSVNKLSGTGTITDPYIIGI